MKINLEDVRRRLCERGWVSVDYMTTLPLTGLAECLWFHGGVRVEVQLDRISPKPSYKAPPRTMSSLYGMGAFPLHTDRAHWLMPPRFILLRSIGDESGRPTLLFDSRKLGAAVRKELWHGVWIVRSHEGHFYCKVLSEDSSGSRIFRYDRCCMEPSSVEAFAVQARLEAELDVEEAVKYSWIPGKVLIIDNRRVLHGRGGSSVEDFGRVLERAVIV